MGAKARETVAHHYTPARFRMGMQNAIAAAQRKFARGAASRAVAAPMLAAASR